MKYLLDTDIASYYLRGKNNLLAIFQEKGFQNIRISRVTVAELEVLAHRNPSSKINFSSIDKFAKQVGVLEVDSNIWKGFSKLKADVLNRGIAKGDIDILIASIANQNGMIVVTNNTSHFSDLSQVENWITS
jgi:tRNA(fMet)-specific endonuclease VapC